MAKCGHQRRSGYTGLRPVRSYTAGRHAAAAYDDHRWAARRITSCTFHSRPGTTREPALTAVPPGSCRGSSPGSACCPFPALRQVRMSGTGGGTAPLPARRPPISRQPGPWPGGRPCSGCARSAAQSITPSALPGP